MRCQITSWFLALSIWLTRWVVFPSICDIFIRHASIREQTSSSLFLTAWSKALMSAFTPGATFEIETAKCGWPKESKLFNVLLFFQIHRYQAIADVNLLAKNLCSNWKKLVCSVTVHKWINSQWRGPNNIFIVKVDTSGPIEHNLTLLQILTS